MDENCLLQAIKHGGNDLIFEYKVGKEEMKGVEILKEKQDDMDFMGAFVQEFTQDKDIQEFIDLLVISRSNMVLVYRDGDSNKQVSIKLPYIILRNHCKVPQELLSTN